jgi:Glycine zipper
VTGNFYQAGLRASSDSSGEIRYLASFRSVALALLYPDFSQKEQPKNAMRGNMPENKKRQNFSTWIVAVGLTAIAAAGCAGGPLTAREKGAGIGALGGAAVGGIIGNAKGHPGAGAAIGGAVGLGAGALIGNYIQGQQDDDYRR